MDMQSSLVHSQNCTIIQAHAENAKSMATNPSWSQTETKRMCFTESSQLAVAHFYLEPVQMTGCTC